MATRVLPFDEQTVLNMLLGALSFINTYRNASFPNIINDNNLISETFHVGNFNELPTSTNFNFASAYGQTSLAKACFEAYEITQNVNWRNLGISLLDAYTYFFFVDQVPNNIFLPGGFQPTDIWANHWLCVSKGTFSVTEGGQGDADNDSYNFGNFDTLVSFSNGMGVIPSGTQTSKVYKVYPTKTNLLSKNVFAPIAANPYQPQTTEYVIDYYVSNYFLTGVNYRFYKNGTFSTTTEMPGTIKLTTTFTGDAKVVWSDYSGGSVVAPNFNDSIRVAQGLIETYPIWHTCKRNDRTFLNSSFLAMYQAYDAFLLAFNTTNVDIWRRATVGIQTTISNLLRRNNYDYSHYYKKENASYAFRYPGTNVVSYNNAGQQVHSLTISREKTADKLNCAKIQINDIVDDNPSVIIQNLTVQTLISSLVKVELEIATDTNNILEITLSTNPSYSSTRYDFSTKNDYVAYLAIANDSVLRNTRFEISDFVKFTNTCWYPTISRNSIVTNNTQFGNVNYSFINQPLNDNKPLVLKAVLTNNGDINAFAAEIQLNNFNTLYELPTIFYKLDIGGMRIRIVDEQYNIFYAIVPNYTQGWFKWQPTWENFTTSSPGVTRGSGFIRNISFELTSDIAEFYLYYVGDYPETIPVGAIALKASIVDRLKTQHTIWLGDFKPLANNLDSSQYLLGLSPFSNEIVIKNSNKIKNRWQDNGLYCAYLSPYHQKYFGYDNYISLELNFINNAQQHYHNQSSSRSIGLITPVVLSTVWESSPFSYYGNKVINNSNTYAYEIGKISWKGGDYNTLTAKYAILPILSVARYLRLAQNDQMAQNIVTQFLQYIEPLTLSAPITNLLPNLDPVSAYHNPSNAALIGLTAINANLAGIQPDTTISIIKNCYNYLRSQYQSSGTMLGSFSTNQSSFTNNANNYKQYTAQYHADVISFLSQLIKYKNQLNILPTVVAGMFPNIAPTSIKSFKEASYPKENLIFSDGNRQALGYQKSKRGRTIEIVYNAITAIDVQRLGQFWQLQGGITASFTLPTTVGAFSKYNGVTWRFQADFKFDTKISTKNLGTFDVTMLIEQCD